MVKACKDRVKTQPTLRNFLAQRFHFMDGSAIIFNHSMIVLEGLILFLVHYFLFRNSQKQRLSYRLSDQNTIRSGFLYGISIVLISLPVVFYFGMSFSPHFSPVDAFGNFFSNGAEEVIYRFILFSAFVCIFRNNILGIVFSAVCFGLAHWDLPPLFQAYIVVVGMLLGFSYLKSRNIAVPYLAHMIADLLLDSFFR